MYFTSLFYQQILPPLIKSVLIILFKHNNLTAHISSPHKLNNNNDNNNNSNNNSNNDNER